MSSGSGSMILAAGLGVFFFPDVVVAVVVRKFTAIKINYFQFHRIIYGK